LAEASVLVAPSEEQRKTCADASTVLIYLATGDPAFGPVQHARTHAPARPPASANAPFSARHHRAPFPLPPPSSLSLYVTSERNLQFPPTTPLDLHVSIRRATGHRTQAIYVH
jgi:hypothetical protein